MKSKILPYIPPKEFIKRVLQIITPLIISQTLSVFVSLADSSMVASVHKEAITAVSVSSQWEFIAFLFSFGILSGLGIYVTQFYGNKDYANLKRTFGLAIFLSLVIVIPFAIIALIFPREIIGFYSNNDQVVIELALKYINIAAISYIPVMISFSYSYVYRCIGQTKIPMLFSITALLINLFLNYCLINGHFWMPKMGITGAALATLIARSCEMALHIIYSLLAKTIFIGTFKENFSFSKDFITPVLKRSSPIFLNEGLFGIGTTLYIKAIAIISTSAIASYAIANQIGNIFFIVFNAIGSGVSAIVGIELGKKEFDNAKKYAKYFIGIGLMCAIISAITIIIIARPTVELLFSNKESFIKNEAVLILFIFSFRFLLRMFNVIFFALFRSGGDSRFLAFVDSGLLWSVGIPIAFICTIVFKFNVIYTVLFIQLEQLLRVAICIIRYSSNKWIKNLTDEVPSK